jgi:hypothetical protein
MIFKNEKLPLKTNLPLFQPSIIPCVRQKKHASINHFRFSRLDGVEIPRRYKCGL